MVGKCVELFRNDLLTHLMRLVSLPGDGVWVPVILVIFVAFLIFYFKKDKIFTLVLIVSPLFGQVVKSLLKNYFQVPRPDAFGCDILTTYGDKFSFPSGHTIFFTIFFGLLAYYSIKNIHSLWGKLLLPISLILVFTIGYSRIYLGAHWYLDVIGGYVVGGGILLMTITLYIYLISVNFLEKSDENRLFDKKGNVRAAGAIVWRDHGRKREYLLVFRGNQNDFSFPKGRIECGETAETAAKREVLEETGYKIRISKKLDTISYNYPEGGGVAVEMFEATVSGQGRKKETNEQELWVLEEDILNKLTYPNLKKYFRKYLETREDV